jgi:hypothetical protein
MQFLQNDNLYGLLNKITHQKQMNDTLFLFLQMKTPYFGPFGILFPVADFKSEKKHL